MGRYQGWARNETIINVSLLLLLLSHSVMSDFLQPHGLQHTRLSCPSPSPRVCSNSLSIELVMPSSHLILCCCLLLLPSTFPSIRVFANESKKVAPCSRLPKYWIFCFSISPSNEYSGLTSMCRKRQESGLTEIIPFKGISARWGQFPVFYIFWGSLRLQSDGAESQVFFPFLSALRAQKLTFEGCSHWWLLSPCLLTGQEILLFSISYS